MINKYKIYIIYELSSHLSNYIYILLNINDAKIHIAKLITNSIGVGEEILGILIVKLSIKIILLD